MPGNKGVSLYEPSNMHRFFACVLRTLISGHSSSGDKFRFAIGAMVAENSLVMIPNSSKLCTVANVVSLRNPPQKHRHIVLYSSTHHRPDGRHHLPFCKLPIGIYRLFILFLFLFVHSSWVAVLVAMRDVSILRFELEG